MCCVKLNNIKETEVASIGDSEGFYKPHLRNVYESILMNFILSVNCI